MNNKLSQEFLRSTRNNAYYEFSSQISSENDSNEKDYSSLILKKNLLYPNIIDVGMKLNKNELSEIINNPIIVQILQNQMKKI